MLTALINTAKVHQVKCDLLLKATETGLNKVCLSGSLDSSNLDYYYY